MTTLRREAQSVDFSIEDFVLRVLPGNGFLLGTIQGPGLAPQNNHARAASICPRLHVINEVNEMDVVIHEVMIVHVSETR